MTVTLSNLFNFQNDLLQLLGHHRKHFHANTRPQDCRLEFSRSKNCCSLLDFVFTLFYYAVRFFFVWNFFIKIRTKKKMENFVEQEKHIIHTLLKC
jgi:hypothetical protein